VYTWFDLHDFSADSWRVFDDLGAVVSAEETRQVSPALPKISLDIWFQPITTPNEPEDHSAGISS
jgi:hypothetical protein